jgi:hypothetical protein
MSALTSSQNVLTAPCDFPSARILVHASYAARSVSRSLPAVAKRARALGNDGSINNGHEQVIPVLRRFLPFVHRGEEQRFRRQGSGNGEHWSQTLENGSENKHLKKSAQYHPTAFIRTDLCEA